MVVNGLKKYSNNNYCEESVHDQHDRHTHAKDDQPRNFIDDGGDNHDWNEIQSVHLPF
jgi:hypothetical protein